MLSAYDQVPLSGGRGGGFECKFILRFFRSLRTNTRLVFSGAVRAWKLSILLLERMKCALPEVNSSYPDTDHFGLKSEVITGWWGPAAGGPAYTRVVMNLPASAVEFLDAFRGACTHSRWQRRLPTVHCYTFSRGDEDSAGGAQSLSNYNCNLEPRSPCPGMTVSLPVAQAC